MKWLRNRKEYEQFCRDSGVRDDWHEPDEQGFTVAEIRGDHMDNAHSTSEREQHIVLQSSDGYAARINLCDLLAWARTYEN